MKVNNTDQQPEKYVKASQGSDEEKKEVVGVDGKYQWPIRIFSFLLFAATVAINYVIGRETGRVSDAFILYTTPLSLFFNIWAVIFTTQALVHIYNLYKNEWTPKAHIFVGINNILLIIWINIFNIGTDVAVYICFLILVATVVIGLLFWTELGKIQEFTLFTYITRNVYAFYLGWVIAATNLNLGIVIKYWWNSTFETQLIIFWVLAPLCAIGVTVLNTCREGKKGLLSCFCLWISVIWAFTGAAIRSNNCLTVGTTCFD